MSDNLNSGTTTADDNNEKLYAGKYKTVDELQSAYENLQKKYSTTSDEKKQLEDKHKAPFEYSLLNDHGLSENEVNGLKDEAKSAQLTQDQFNVLVRKKSDTVKERSAAAQRTREELGEEKINVLKDYVARNYPPSIGKEMLEKVILDPKLREEAFQHRDKMISNSGHGIGNTSDVYEKVTKDELQELALKVDKNPNNSELRNLYIKKLAISAKQKNNGTY